MPVRQWQEIQILLLGQVSQIGFCQLVSWVELLAHDFRGRVRLNEQRLKNAATIRVPAQELPP